MDISSIGSSIASNIVSSRSDASAKAKLPGHNEQRHESFKAEARAEALSLSSSNSDQNAKGSFHAVG